MLYIHVHIPLIERPRAAAPGTWQIKYQMPLICNRLLLNQGGGLGWASADFETRDGTKRWSLTFREICVVFCRGREPKLVLSSGLDTTDFAKQDA